MADEIGFYHLTRTPLEQALPRLLEKAYERGQWAVVRVTSEERLTQLDRALWTYARESFLPHGVRRDGFVDEQPIYLTRTIENPNGAALLVLVDGAPLDDHASFKRLIEMFDGRDKDAVADARSRWRWAEEEGLDRVYWQQDEDGRWREGTASRRQTPRL